MSVRLCADARACPTPRPRRPSAPRRASRPRCRTSSVAAARRTSPGLMPTRWALARSTSISNVGSWRRAVDGRVSETPSIAGRAPRLVRLRRMTARSEPKRDTGRRRPSAAASTCCDPLLGIGEHRVLEAGIAVDDPLDGATGRAVVGRAIDVHPELAGVDVDDLVGQDGPPDVGTDVADPGQRPQLAAPPGGDPVHLRARRARRRRPSGPAGPLSLNGGHERAASAAPGRQPATTQARRDRADRHVEA